MIYERNNIKFTEENRLLHKGNTESRKVVFHEGMFALLSKELPAYSALNYHCMKDGRSAWRVIGNVHDNPELI
ncbi:YopX family protein [Prevotella intermedia]